MELHNVAATPVLIRRVVSLLIAHHTYTHATSVVFFPFHFWIRRVVVLLIAHHTYTPHTVPPSTSSPSTLYQSCRCQPRHTRPFPAAVRDVPSETDARPPMPMPTPIHRPRHPRSAATGPRKQTRHRPTTASMVVTSTIKRRPARSAVPAGLQSQRTRLPQRSAFGGVPHRKRRILLMRMQTQRPITTPMGMALVTPM